MQENLNQYKEGLDTSVSSFESRVAEMHKETVWKIKDVEQLLAARISEHKVNNLVTSLDKKLT